MDRQRASWPRLSTRAHRSYPAASGRNSRRACSLMSAVSIASGFGPLRQMGLVGPSRTKSMRPGKAERLGDDRVRAVQHSSWTLFQSRRLLLPIWTEARFAQVSHHAWYRPTLDLARYATAVESCPWTTELPDDASPRAAILRAGRLLRLPVRALVWLARAVRRYFWLLVLAGAVGAFVVVVLIPQVTTDGDEDDAPPQEPVAATRQDLRVTVPAVGTIDYGSIIELGFAEAGVIAGIAVAEGDVVAAGGTLATLEAADLERDVDDAEAALRRAQLDLAELLADPDPMDLAPGRAGSVRGARRPCRSGQPTGRRQRRGG